MKSNIKSVCEIDRLGGWKEVGSKHLGLLIVDKSTSNATLGVVSTELVWTSERQVWNFQSLGWGAFWPPFDESLAVVDEPNT